MYFTSCRPYVEREWGGERGGEREGWEGGRESCITLIVNNNCDHLITIFKAVFVRYDYV